ncbi:hypothetical protein [Flammeovirga kamogawensis]|uniref:Transporter n=1 Tax=Flammeovirga kamogawensis TaxID=373891 RepID=A0ABX8GRM0_9BACT|nr:hypothetical protein [Flammeovirga kamogawensis]MBB6462723.1 hypothetical protein [Flammeovirga kamogawensis]QWG06044.1 hypothetical protein KM029_11795 [Flammeovirga kamogawensis]TRX67876.1 hypothetical protein EO216_06815 [Flammeovirga kamogawensis]
MKGTLKYLTLLLLLSASSLAYSQSRADEIAQKLQNPLSKLSALPIQNNIGYNADNSVSYGLSFQPIHATSYDNFNLIHRAVIGVNYTPGMDGGAEIGKIDGQWGLTDINYSLLFSPKTVKKVAWGVGPSINLPTATSDAFGSGQWSGGLSAVLVYQTGKWTFDSVIRQTWSFAGDNSRAGVNQMVFQPLIAYSLGNGWIINTFPTIMANWDHAQGQQWTVPVGGGLSKVIFMGNLPVAIGAQYYKYVVRPDLAPTQEFRLMANFVFSK